ncbi:MAG: DinB family protein, partial [Planctomycetota bacterium]
MNVAEDLRAEIERTLPLLRALDEAAAMRDRGPGKWVRKEILGHLIDSAANNIQRFVRAALAGRLAFPSYDQDPWVALQRYRQRPWRELVGLWEALN